MNRIVGYAGTVDNEQAFSSDGAFLTGDLGRIGDREFLSLTGRKMGALPKTAAGKVEKVELKKGLARRLKPIQEQMRGLH